MLVAGPVVLGVRVRLGTFIGRHCLHLPHLVGLSTTV